MKMEYVETEKSIVSLHRDVFYNAILSLTVLESWCWSQVESGRRYHLSRVFLKTKLLIKMSNSKRSKVRGDNNKFRRTVFDDKSKRIN